MHTDSVVVSIGGSILVPGENDSEYIMRLASMLKEASKDSRIAVICGGGKTARYYAGIAKELGGGDYQQDILGIAATRMNAQLLALALGDMPDDVCRDPEELASEKKRISVMGGTEPGHTTDAVTAMVAKALGASRMINATSVDGVYTADPRTHPDAEKISRMTIDELGEIVYKEHGAAKSSVFDPLGVKIAKENAIDILIIDGRDLGELRNAILGKEIKGTFVDSHRAAPGPRTAPAPARPMR
ncbi:MAG: UMP kinase [Candidatus Methanomethylophilaceae archaeon]|nr:UMP kinase [Candidatus Methanomethylophilaceae archaeon]